MNKYVIFGIIGIISGLVAALADVPLVKPGKVDPNETLAWRNGNRGDCYRDRCTCSSNVVSAFKSDCFTDCFNDSEEMRRQDHRYPWSGLCVICSVTHNCGNVRCHCPEDQPCKRSYDNQLQGKCHNEILTIGCKVIRYNRHGI